ncbi:MAG: electron transport complex subunit RsxA [SAR324 cluster bacterium]|nr:electron transport complex subunit RsxA [SAR324 cluster bacterium]
MDNLIWIFISAVLVNNFTLSLFLGLCPFLGVTQRVQTAFRLGLANIFVMIITAMASYALNTWVLIHAPYLRLISFIIVIASAVQFVEMAIKKLSPELFKALGIFLPLITTNCAILGLALFSTAKGYGFVEGLIYAAGAGLGVTLALVLLAGIREETRILNINKLVEGTALNLIIAGIVSMAFMGFAGLFGGG